MIIALLMVGMMAATFHPNIDNKRRIRELVQAVKTRKGPDTVVLICPAWLDLGFTYYYNQEYFKNYKEYKKMLNSEKIYPLNRLDEIDTSALNQIRHVLYFEEWATLVDKNEEILHYLKKHYSESETFHFYESFTLREFKRPAGLD